MNWDAFWGLVSAFGGIAIILGAWDARRKMRERNRAIEQSWHAHKPPDDAA